MKKLILLAAVAAGVAYVVKFKSDQVKSAATKVTHDPRVQSALATASEKAGPVAASVSSTVSSATAAASSAVSERLGKGGDDLSTPDVPDQAVEVAESDPVSAPEFATNDATEMESTPKADPLTDPLTAPLETLEDPEGPQQ